MRMAVYDSIMMANHVIRLESLAALWYGIWTSGYQVSLKV
jgi:hypothetical protein